MKRLLRTGVLCLAVVAMAAEAAAGPRFSAGTAIGGVVVYQDDADTTQFHYLPAQVQVVLGGTLKDFKVTYWGVGPAHFAQDATGAIYPVTGAIVAGTAAFDISPTQRTAVIAEIRKAFNVDNPKLLPLSLKNVKVMPTIDAKTLALGGTVQINFPDTVAFTSEFAFSVGTGNSLFAQVVAAGRPNEFGVRTNPTFGLNIAGDVEFVGDPWTAEIDCDLSQVWKQMRSSASASVGLGWFRIGSASYQSISQDLQKSGACKFNMKEGSLDTAVFGRQVFEMVKRVFEELNAKAIAGEGFFKFEPNPEAPAANAPSPGWSPWSISVNLAYSSAYFSQSIKWQTKVSYTGRFTTRVPAGMALAVSCNSTTRDHFVDLSNTAEACVTQGKVDTFNARMRAEAAAKTEKIAGLNERYILGELTDTQYQKLVDYYNRISLTETATPVPAEVAQPMLAAPPAAAIAGAKSFKVGFTPAQLRAMENAVLKGGSQ
jgi:hypothetical protein